jgi:flagellin-specific chaperone FliS
MGKHTVELEIGSQTYNELLSLAQASGQSLDVMLLEAARRVLEDASDMAAIERYQEQKANGTLKTVSLAQLSAELGLDR